VSTHIHSLAISFLLLFIKLYLGFFFLNLLILSCRCLSWINQEFFHAKPGGCFFSFSLPGVSLDSSSSPQVWFSFDLFYNISSWLVLLYIFFGARLPFKDMVAAKHTKFFFLTFQDVYSFKAIFMGEWEFRDTSVKYFFFPAFLFFFLFFSVRWWEGIGWREDTGYFMVEREISFWQVLWWIFILFLFYFFLARDICTLASILLHYTTSSRICSPC